MSTPHGARSPPPLRPRGVRRSPPDAPHARARPRAGGIALDRNPAPTGAPLACRTRPLVPRTHRQPSEGGDRWREPWDRSAPWRVEPRAIDGAGLSGVARGGRQPGRGGVDPVVRDDIAPERRRRRHGGVSGAIAHTQGDRGDADAVPMRHGAPARRRPGVLRAQPRAGGHEPGCRTGDRDPPPRPARGGRARGRGARHSGAPRPHRRVRRGESPRVAHCVTMDSIPPHPAFTTIAKPCTQRTGSPRSPRLRAGAPQPKGKGRATRIAPSRTTPTRLCLTACDARIERGRRTRARPARRLGRRCVVPHGSGAGEGNALADPPSRASTASPAHPAAPEPGRIAR